MYVLVSLTLIHTLVSTDLHKQTHRGLFRRRRRRESSDLFVRKCTSFCVRSYNCETVKVLGDKWGRGLICGTFFLGARRFFVCFVVRQSLSRLSRFWVFLPFTKFLLTGKQVSYGCHVLPFILNHGQSKYPFIGNRWCTSTHFLLKYVWCYSFKFVTPDSDVSITSFKFPLFLFLYRKRHTI